MAKLYFNYAAMNAGKSTVLLQSSFNYRERGMHTIEFTAAIDSRAEVGTITSRIGLTKGAFLFGAKTDIFKIIYCQNKTQNIDCVFLDEAQFLSVAQVMQLTKVVDQLNIPVVCYGLRTDFLGQLFSGSMQLLAVSDEIRELKTICRCGRKAIMNLRIDDEGNAVVDGEKIEIGGNDRYTALCRKHFFEALQKSEKAANEA